MFNRIFPAKKVGLVITNKVQAYESKRGVFLNEDIESIIDIKHNKNLMNIPDYWLKKSQLEIIYKKVLKEYNSFLIKPQLLLCIPHELTLNDCKQIMLDTTLSVGFRKTYIVDNLLVAAVGSNLSIEERRKKVLLYYQDEKIYLALFYAGSVIDVMLIQKKLSDLTQEDIILRIEEIQNNLPSDVSKYFLKIKDKLTQTDLVNDWNTNEINNIYLSLPKEYMYNYSNYIGKYQVTKLEYEDCLIKGVESLFGEIDKL
ncbi:rod shape-determining protein [Natronospora cellulosivora (SeqCode)]